MISIVIVHICGFDYEIHTVTVASFIVVFVMFGILVECLRHIITVQQHNQALSSTFIVVWLVLTPFHKVIIELCFEISLVRTLIVLQFNSKFE